jgi:hypothetical protein
MRTLVTGAAGFVGGAMTKTAALLEYERATINGPNSSSMFWAARWQFGHGLVRAGALVVSVG